MQRKYPDATEFGICSLIGGFFFLRFINPAIVTPNAYMLVDDLPQSAKNPRRTLTLIAKMLQNLANKASYAKEAYMSSLNPFVESNKSRINNFLNALCDVGDFYDTLEVCLSYAHAVSVIATDAALLRWTNTWRFPKRIFKSASLSMSSTTLNLSLCSISTHSWVLYVVKAFSSQRLTLPLQGSQRQAAPADPVR